MMNFYKNLNIDLLFNSLPGYVYWLDSNNVFLGCNTNQAKALGLMTYIDIVGRKFSDFQNILNEKMTLRINDQVLTSGIPIVIEEVLLSKDHSVRCISQKIPLKDNLGSVIGILNISETDGKEFSLAVNPVESNENLTRSAKDINTIKKESHITSVFFNNITESLPQYLFWKDVNSVYLGCNRNYAKLVGLNSPNDIIGKTDNDLHWQSTGDTTKTFQQGDKDTIAGKSITNQEEILALPTGKRLVTIVSKLPIVDEGKVIGIVGYFTDVTALKIAEEREQSAMAAKMKAEASELIFKTKAEKEEEMRKTVMVLVGDIVHDLRTPIATIRTIGRTFSNTLPKIFDVVEEARDLGSKKINLLNEKKLKSIFDNTLVGALNDSVVMIDNFINSALAELANAQKSQQGEFSGEDLTKCSSRRILENTLDSYPRRENIIINKHFPYDFFLMGNSILIMKILFNLIQNAEEQIALNGKGEITITTEETENRNLLKVRDTAGGAPPEVVANFFKEFFTTKKHGTGIGLSFCKKTMRNFGGDLTCHSVFGESMEFTLSFPKIATNQ